MTTPTDPAPRPSLRGDRRAALERRAADGRVATLMWASARRRRAQREAADAQGRPPAPVRGPGPCEA